MLKKGIGRVKPGARARSKPSPGTHGPPYHVPPHLAQPQYVYPMARPHYNHHENVPHPHHGHHATPHGPPIYHATPPGPPHHHEPQSKDKHHNQKGDHKGHKESHHGPHPPPPPPGYFKRFFQYILDTLKKRPVLYTVLFGSALFHTHRILQPEAHNKHMADLLLTLKTKSNSLNALSGVNEKIKISKLNDSLKNYSKSFLKASSGADVANTFENLQAHSLLNNLKGFENNLSQETIQEIERLTEAFQKDNARVTAALGATANQLRHCQLMGIISSSHNKSSDSSGNASEADSLVREQTHKADMLSREQTNKSLQAKFSDLTAEKFALETQFIQLVCDLLDDSQKDILCTKLMKNNASSVSKLLKTPVLYPEINGLSSTKRAVYVLKFDGNLTASGVSTLRHEITAIVENADKNRGDRVVVVLESGGGTVGGYGLGASQLERIKAAGLHLTVCVDEVAASGGYLMACVADELISAPFACLGSIGVMTMVPNFHERLKREGVHVDTVTAGEFKTTLTPTSKPTPENRKKLQNDLNHIHNTFKSHINKYRPQVDIDRVATGETWLASDALVLGLCDSISTSDDYLLQLSKAEGTEVFKVKYNLSRKQSVMQKMLQEQDDDEISAVDNSSYIADTMAQIIAKTISQVAWEGDSGRVQMASTERKH